MLYFIFKFAFLLSLCGQLQATIRFLTFHINKPEFIELQYKTFKKFVHNDHEFIIINDARTKEMELAIQQMCKKYNITCVRYEQEWHLTDPITDRMLEIFPLVDHSFRPEDINMAIRTAVGNQPSVRHSHVIQYALDHYGYAHDDLVVILDGDFFPIRPTDIRLLMEGNHIAGPYRNFPKKNIGYFWVPFIAMNMPFLPNKSDLKFHVDVANSMLLDTGGHSYYYLKNNPDVTTKKYDYLSSVVCRNTPESYLKTIGFTDKEIAFSKSLPDQIGSEVEFHLNHQFLHYGASSYRENDEKLRLVMNFLKKLLHDRPHENISDMQSRR